MENLAIEALSALQQHNIPVETKLSRLTNLKQEIKHRHCPDVAIPKVFHVIRLALATHHVVDAGFSILGHITKRLMIQDHHNTLHSNTLKLFPVLLERLGDPKVRLQQRAVAALTDDYTVNDASRKDVEQFVRETALPNRNPRTKRSALQWTAIAATEKGMLFRSFVPNLVGCLEDSDGEVRQTAQSTLIQIFKDSSTKSKQDLQKVMAEKGVRKSIESYVLTELGVSTNPRIAQSADQEAVPISSRMILHPEAPLTTHIKTAEAPSPEVQPMSVAEQEAAQLTPVYIESARDLEDIFREMHPWFDGKEAESNWLKREKSIEKLRRITKGNAPHEYTTLFLASIKTLLDGILKTVNSLRTTVCTIGCHLVQDLARVCGPGLDNMVEILLQNLIKLCGNTKKISASKSSDTVNAIMAHVSYHVRLLQHIQTASSDKNVQPRTYACGWLKTILAKHGHSRSAMEHSGGIDLVEKTVKNGLNDSNPTVRENMRPVYWAFARIWGDRSETIMAGLSQTHQDMLVKHSANPHPPSASSVASMPAAPSGKQAFSKSVGAGSSRPSIKETIAAQKRAQAAHRGIADRPGSAAGTVSPTKTVAPPRPATAMSTTSRHVSSQSVGTLSSAPVRPRRRADNARPVTADVPASKLPRAETPKGSPANSPARPRPKTPGLAASAFKFAPKKVSSPATSPAKSKPEKKPMSAETSPTKAAEDFTMVIPDLNKGVTSGFPADFSGDNPIRSNHSSPSRSPITPNTLALNVSNLSIDDEPSRPANQPIPNESRGSPTQGAQRISMSPRNLASRKEHLQSRALGIQDQRPLKVYEDPVSDGSGATQPTPVFPRTPRALGELPVNEPASSNRKVMAEPSSPSKLGDLRPNHERKEYQAITEKQWEDLSRSEVKKVDHSERIENPMVARKIMDSAIVRIQARSLDVHGFRKLQSVIRHAPEDVWEDGYKFQELLMPLLEFLEAAPKFKDVPDALRDQDVKTQMLVALKLLLKNQHQWFEPFFPQAICAIISTRKHYHPSTHMVAGLEETIEEIIEGDEHPNASVSAVLDLLEVDRSKDNQAMALWTLSGLLAQCHRKGEAPDLERLGHVGNDFLANSKPNIRRAALEMILAIRPFVQDNRFWELLAGTSNEQKRLITYYLARQESAQK